MKNEKLTGLVWVVLFTILYILAASVYALKTGNGEFVFYIVVMVVLGLAAMVVHHHAHLSLALLWCLSLWGMMHMAGGLVPVPEAWPINGDKRVLYSWWLIPGRLKYDHIVHAYGFGVTSWLCWQALVTAFRVPAHEVKPSAGLLTLCAAAGVGFGGLNEIIEFTATRMMPETNVGGYVNTGWDLVANLVGCIVAVVWIRLAWKPSRPEKKL